MARERMGNRLEFEASDRAGGVCPVAGLVPGATGCWEGWLGVWAVDRIGRLRGRFVDERGK